MGKDTKTLKNKIYESPCILVICPKTKTTFFDWTRMKKYETKEGLAEKIVPEYQIVQLCEKRK